MSFRSRIISLALRLQQPPFIWIFQLYYWMAIQWCRILLARIDGVQSIYLTGSWAHQEVICGLSDIDFKIFVAGIKCPNTVSAIHRQFSFLRRLFPILGPPDEKGIYFLDSFASDYRHHPLIQHLFDERFFRHRLLWGADLLRRLPLKSWKDLDQGECTYGRLKDWIERIHILADYSGFSASQKQHLYFKAVSDVAHLTLCTEFPESQFSRRSEILRQIHCRMEEPYRNLIENLILENRERYRRKLNTDKENFALFKRMISLCAERVSRRDSSKPAPLTVEGRAIPCSDCDPAVCEAMRALSPRIAKVRAIRWPQLPLNPFDLHLFNTPAFLVECKEPLEPDALHSLKDYYRKNLRNKGTILLQENSLFLTSVDSQLVDHWGSFPGSSDLLHLIVAGGRYHVTTVEQMRIETRLRAFREQLADAMADPQFGRMNPAILPAFFLNALRVLIFSHEFRHGKWHWAVTPGEITDFLLQYTPLAPSFPHALVEQFENVKEPGASFDERLLPKARALLAAMLEIAQNDGSWGSLSKLNALPDEQYLAISAAIVTAKRPLQLKRCLLSIKDLGRQPEELIVVNGGPDPMARQIVEDAHLACPVRYLESNRPGVAHARNLAVRHCTGEIIAFVDDDACVAPDWLDRIERVFLRDPKIGLAAGSILNMQCKRSDKVWQFMEAVEKV